MKRLKINRTWHEKHKMPAKATLEQRIRWHLEHRKHCGCRPIPRKVEEVIRTRALL